MHAGLLFSPLQALILFVLSMGISGAAEAAGTTWGAVFFGRYAYTDLLGPALWGVPLAVNRCWIGRSSPQVSIVLAR